MPTLLKPVEICGILGLSYRMMAGCGKWGRFDRSARSQVQEVLQSSEIAVFRRALDIVVGLSMIRALLPILGREPARLSRLTQRDK
jgi:hypothetical protein